MTAPIKQVSFCGGEVTPDIFSRTDHIKYETGLRTLRNMLAMRHGGVTNRPGTQFVDNSLNGGNSVRLIPFIFNETGVGQSYMLEFGNQYIAFVQNGGRVITAPNTPYVISSPYLQADLASLKFAESADIITIVHPNYAPMELARFGPTNWVLSTISFGPTQVGVTSLAASGTGGGDTVVYYVVAVNGTTGEQSRAASVTKNNFALPTGSTPITLTWVAAAGASFYNIYYSPSSGVGGFIGQSTSGTFIDQGLVTPDFANNPPTPNNPFIGAGNFPSTVGFVQQRRAFANTLNNPVGFWLSQPGLFYNFDTSVTLSDSDSVSASIAGEEVNAIQAIVELKFMLLLTSGAEIYVQGNGTGVVTPTAINASVQSQYGCNALRPLKVSDVLLFNQALGSFVRDFSFDFSIDGYRGNDITVFSAHLFEENSIVDWSYQKIPDSIVWAVRNDGVLLGLTYVREQQVLAWHHHDFTGGTVENVCAIPENGNYAVYLSIKRTINGTIVRYIERLSSRFWQDELFATYLDCYASYNGMNTAIITMTLTVPGGGSFATDNNAYRQQLTLTASGGFFTPTMVGDQIFLNDQLFNVTPGTSGNLQQGFSGDQVRCTIIAYTSNTVVTVIPNRIVPPDLQQPGVSSWSHAVNTVSGLNYLAGQQVSVWADRFVVGSPLNSQLAKVYTVPLSGILTLDKCYSVIYVGLPITADFQTLDIETSFGESILATRKRQVKLGVYLKETRTFFVGSEDPDTNLDNTANDPLFQLFEYKTGLARETFDEPPQLLTDQDYMLEDTRYNKNGRIFIRHVDPTPLTILAVSPGGDTKAPTPYYQKV